MLYGKDYGDKLCKAVNCGYDTDCTGATLGALLGILDGTVGIPRKWRSPICESIILHRFTGRFNAPKTISELTERTFQIAKRVLQEKSDVTMFGEKKMIPANVLSLLFRNEKALATLNQDTQAGVSMEGDIEITMHYWGEPVIRPNIEKMLGISVRRNNIETDADVTLGVPEGWIIKPAKKAMGQNFFIILTLQVQDKNIIDVTIFLSDMNCHTRFVILGPNEAQGYASGKNVPTCPTCHAWSEACICNKEVT